MSFIDWLILIVPTAMVFALGVYSMKYVHGVTDFLSAGRVAGRYVLSVGDVANALSIIGLVAYVEVQYKTGFALVFWNNIMLPLGVIMSLFGYCTYRFRETRAMSLGQFLEMRYNRPFRVFASALRSLSEMLANMIMPAIAARFFIYFLDLPRSFTVCGIEVSTFGVIVVLCLTIAISLICFGGTLSLLITDAVQGILLFPLMVVFVVFVLYKFSWGAEIIPVMSDRVVNESFLNPYDISNLRDFNLVMVFMTIIVSVIHRASWIGAGYSTAAKTPHEQKMAGLLGTWRGAIVSLLYVLIAICIITVMNHADFATKAKAIRSGLSTHIAEEIVAKENRADFVKRINAVPEQLHTIGKDTPLSQAQNLDTPVLNTAHEAFKSYEGEAAGNAKFQEFRTLYHQLMMATSMRELLPPILMGLFCLLLVLAMISTDDTRIYSASLTFTQDVILPFCKNGISPKTHIRLLRWVSVGVGVFFLIGSFFMSQLDYINLFVTLMCMMWLGGCGPVMIFGLYSRFGNTAGAFASLISGMLLSIFSIFVQRNWADVVYPWLLEMEWAEGIGSALETISAPLNPYVVWKMDPVKFPVNSTEIFAITILASILAYVLISFLTLKRPFNLEWMLHRGEYNDEGKCELKEKWTLRTVFRRLVGISPEYTRGDKALAWSVFCYSFVWNICIVWAGSLIWNLISPWKLRGWSNYFWVVNVVVPGIIGVITSIWFTWGGIRDIRQLFIDLKKRIVDYRDNGMVDKSDLQ